MQIKLHAAPNFRDLGGLPARNTQRIRQGFLYRSDALDSLSDTDLALLRPLQIKLIFDLRSAPEREHLPNRLPSDWVPEILVTDSKDAGAADIGRAFRHEMYSDVSHVRSYMEQTYRSFPRIFAPILAQLFARLADGIGPVLIHCAAGKDRTGFICAMLLYALGVPSEEIFEDYLLSDRHFGPERIRQIVEQRAGMTPSPEMVDLLRVRRKYLESVIEDIEKEYGSVDSYLEQQAGLTASRREVLQARLIE